MTNPGEDGWFPECLNCGMGNINGAVCLPAAAAFDLHLIDRTAGWPAWPLWGYLVFWLVAMPLAWWATAWAGKPGARKAASADPARRTPGQDPNPRP